MAPPTEAAEVDVLRRAAGLSEPFHVAPHLTLVPPINVAEVDLPIVMALLRRVAAAAHPVDLDVGPVATFLPETPTLHLTVGGADVDCLRSLRGHLRAGPFDRPDVWPFNPHVTICERADTALIDAGLRAFAGLRQRWTVTALHLLEQRRHGPDHPRHGQACWIPVREEPLGGPSVVGRGGVELVLRTVSTVEPDVAGLVELPASGSSRTTGPERIVVVAESPGDPRSLLGAAVGRWAEGATVADLDVVAVAAGRRGIGVGSQLLRSWVSAAASRGAEAVTAAQPHDDVIGTGFLRAHGFEQAHSRWYLRL